MTMLLRVTGGCSFCFDFREASEILERGMHCANSPFIRVGHALVLFELCICGALFQGAIVGFSVDPVFCGFSILCFTNYYLCPPSASGCAKRLFYPGLVGGPEFGSCVCDIIIWFF